MIDHQILHFTLEGEDYLLVNCYFRHYRAAGKSVQLYKALESLWADVQKFNIFCILLARDFNAIFDPDLDTNANSKEEQYRHAKVFSDFVHGTDLMDSWRAYQEKCFTWHRGNVAARIDHILTSSLLLNYLHTVDIGLSFRSDHCPVYATFLMNRNEIGPGIFRFPQHRLKDEEYREYLKKL